MFSFKNVSKVHLEITDKCNASCPMCPRTTNGGPLNPNLRNIEMNLDLAKRVFTPTFLNKLTFIQLCGNFGDPIMAQDTIEILKYFREINPKIGLGVHTNGSARTPQWWTELGKILSHPGDYCKFALDGLEDTNHIYRRKTVWSKIMQSVEAFVAAGGIAHWEFLVFKHNEHQVEEARALSQKMGFKEFYLKKTSRFYNYKTGENEPFPIYDVNSKTVGFLEPPSEEKNINPATTAKSDAASTNAAVEAKSVPMKEVTQISCMSINDGSIYITAAGEVLPCCFIGGTLQYAHNSLESKYLNKLGNRNSKGLIVVQPVNKEIEDIIEGDWFKCISESWTNESSEVHTCKMLCRKSFKIVSSEYG